MFPEIPEDRTGLTAPELRALVRELRSYARTELAANGVTDDVRRARDLAVTLSAEAAELDEAAALEAELSEEGDPAETEEETEETEEVETEESSTESDPAPAAAVAAAPVPSGTAIATNIVEPPALLDVILASDGVSGRDPGEHFDDWSEVAAALHDRAQNISPTSTQRFEVARVPGQYPTERQLGSDPIRNMQLLGNLGFGSGVPSREELTAALCAPLTPYYGMACENTLRRPVAASLPGFQAPRGGVSIMPSPSLSDVSMAGIWTHEDDDDEEADKPCDVIVCGTPEDFIMYAVYWCLRIKNWTALTFPELVEAFLNRGLALRARVAERQLLDAMGAGVPSINTPELGYGSAVRVTTQVLNYLTLLREEQRWDDEPMNGWAHRQLLAALRLDQSRRNRDGSWMIASEAEVNARFADVGVNMTWTLDSATWMTPVPNLTTAESPSTTALGELSALPTEAEILIAPVGKYAMIDRAQLGIGVTGNNLYRDSAQMARNEFTFFVENYEGVVDTTSCPSHILRFEGLCHSGQQIADVAIDCDGALDAA